jgi:hypothetical protein
MITNKINSMNTQTDIIRLTYNDVYVAWSKVARSIPSIRYIDSQCAANLRSIIAERLNPIASVISIEVDKITRKRTLKSLTE